MLIMVIEETQDAELDSNNPLSQGIVIFPETKEDLETLRHLRIFLVN